ncbi:hypothetical protein MMC28_001982 [Mycoblastus sanguinarius]|nr:hypothetical protein [Mycoblastus sanguinarius]
MDGRTSHRGQDLPSHIYTAGSCLPEFGFPHPSSETLLDLHTGAHFEPSGVVENSVRPFGNVIAHNGCNDQVIRPAAATGISSFESFNNVGNPFHPLGDFTATHVVGNGPNHAAAAMDFAEFRDPLEVNNSFDPLTSIAATNAIHDGNDIDNGYLPANDLAAGKTVYDSRADFANTIGLNDFKTSDYVKIGLHLVNSTTAPNGVNSQSAYAVVDSSLGFQASSTSSTINGLFPLDSSNSRQTGDQPTVHHPLTCVTCGRSFGRVSDMERHAKKHQAVRMYQCQFEGCEYKGSYWKYKLDAHVKRRHQTGRAA